LQLRGAAAVFPQAWLFIVPISRHKAEMTRRGLFKWLGVGAVSIFGGGAAFSAWKPGNFYYDGPVSDHFDGTHFFNPGGRKPRSISEVLRWQISKSRDKWPSRYPSSHEGAKPQDKHEGARPVITMIGHATLLIQMAGRNFITDPVFVERASPVQFAGPKRVNPPGVRFEDLPKIDYVLLTHNHYDHLDLASLDRLSREHGATIVCPLGNDAIIGRKTFDARFMVGDWHDSFDLGGGLKLHFEPCQHWSARGVKDRRMALWSAYVLEHEAFKLLHVGDTGFGDGKPYRDIAERHGSVDLAILPIGALEPRWFMEGQHQDPYEAVKGMKIIGAKRAVGHHWGTFQLTDEGLEVPLERLADALSKAGLNENVFPALRPGQSVRL